MSTRIHTSVNIGWALGLRDRQLARLVKVTRDGVLQPVAYVRGYLTQLRSQGLEYLAMDCPAPSPDGSCPGHIT